MKKVIALVLALSCLIVSASAELVTTWGKVIAEGENGAVVLTLEGVFFVLEDGELETNDCLVLLIDDCDSPAYTDDFVLFYEYVPEDAHPYLRDL